MPLFSSTSGISARALGLTSGILSGAAAITSILGNQNGTTGTQLLVYFNAGTPGSSPVTDYQYSLNGGSTWNTFASPQTSSPLTISGLTNGTTYSVAIRPMQGLQPSVASNVSSGRPVALPTTPSITSITNDANGTTGTHISVAFTGGTGGTDSTTTFQFSTDNGSTWTNRTTGTTASPILITGLANGTSYNVRIRAVTSIGDFSAQSATSIARPVALPGAPTISAITASTGQLSVAFSVGQAGTDAPATYEYSLDGGSTYFGRQTGTTASPIVITGVTDSTVANANKSLSPTYSVRIRSVTPQNHRSAGSAAVTPSATPPSVPFILNTTAADTSFAVVFNAATAGSYSISHYERSLNNGSTWVTYVSNTGITEGANGLTPNTSYTVLLRTVDVQGVAGPSDSRTVQTLQESLPQAPAAPTVTPVDGTTDSLQISFTAATQGTYSVASHQYKIELKSLPGTGTWVATPTTAGTPFTISGLNTDAEYDVYIRGVASVSGSPGFSSAAGAGQVHPGAPATPTARFSQGSSVDGTFGEAGTYSSMTTSSYGTVYIRINKPTYATIAFVSVDADNAAEIVYNSVTHAGDFSDKGTHWIFKKAQSNNRQYTYKAKVANRINDESSYTAPATWTTPKTGQAYTKGDYGSGGTTSTTERYMVRTDHTTLCTSQFNNHAPNFYGVSFSGTPTDSNQPGFITITSISIDIKDGNTNNPDFSESGYSRIMRFNWGAGSGADEGSKLTVNTTTSYATRSKTGLNYFGSSLNGKTFKFEMLDLGATLNASCVPAQYGPTSNGGYFWVRNFRVSGTTTIAGVLSDAAGVNWT